MTDKEIFAKYLKDAKERLMMNHNEFADLIGHSRDTYIKWYTADNGCSDEKKKLIKARIREVLK